MSVRGAARAANAVGINAIPIRGDGSKAPVCKWKRWQQERQTRAVVDVLFAPKFGGREHDGLALIGGRVSGGLVLLDFDDMKVFARWKRAARKALPEILDLLLQGFLVKTPRGVRLAFRTSMPVTSGPLAAGVDVKSEGGYAIVAPSTTHVHPSGKIYKQEAGSFATIPTLTAEQAQQVLDSIRALAGGAARGRPRRAVPARDRKPVPAIESLKTPPPAEGEPVLASPSADFDARASWGALLEPTGWECVDEYECVDEDTGEEWTQARWRRPDKDGEGHSATTNHNGNGRLVVFSTNAEPFEDWNESRRSYRKFEAWALLAAHDRPRSSQVLIALMEAGYGRG